MKIREVPLRMRGWKRIRQITEIKWNEKWKWKWVEQWWWWRWRWRWWVKKSVTNDHRNVMSDACWVSFVKCILWNDIFANAKMKWKQWNWRVFWWFSVLNGVWHAKLCFLRSKICASCHCVHVWHSLLKKKVQALIFFRFVESQSCVLRLFCPCRDVSNTPSERCVYRDRNLTNILRASLARKGPLDSSAGVNCYNFLKK